MAVTVYAEVKESNHEVIAQIEELNTEIKADVAFGYYSAEDLDEVLSQQDSLIEELKDELKGKTAGVGEFETWTITFVDGSVIEKEVAIK